MNRELCNRLRIYKIEQVLATTGSEVIPESNAQPLTIWPDDMAALEISPDISDTGLSFKIEQILTISKVSPEKAILFGAPTPSIIEGETTSGEKIVIGSTDFPASVYIIPHLQKDQLSISCTMLRSPF